MGGISWINTDLNTLKPTASPSTFNQYGKSVQSEKLPILDTAKAVGAADYGVRMAPTKDYNLAPVGTTQHKESLLKEISLYKPEGASRTYRTDHGYSAEQADQYVAGLQSAYDSAYGTGGTYGPQIPKAQAPAPQDFSSKTRTFKTTLTVGQRLAARSKVRTGGNK